jgi:pimeloyl-ACP methyl ester carboxylesterase
MDRSGAPVIRALQASGYHVTVPEFAEIPLAHDVARLRHLLVRQKRPTIVVGHGYGGQIMTALGDDAPNVVALVYVAAFGLDQGEMLGAVLGGAAPTRALARLIVDEQGLAWLPENDFLAFFAADVAPDHAKVMHALQRPLPVRAFEDIMGVPAWRSLPSWYLIAADDQAVPPELERRFAERMEAYTLEVVSSHLPMVSHPAEVTGLIEAAAQATCGEGPAG